MAKNLKFSIKGIDIADNLVLKVEKNVNSGLEDVAMDLTRVSSSLTPMKTGKLKDSYKQKKGKSNGLDSYIISYKAFNKGFNYANWTHNATYNLGEVSRNRIPSRSKYSTKTFKVGPGYLENTANELEKNYTTYIANKVKSALKSKR